jgi:hypothetical protein
MIKLCGIIFCICFGAAFPGHSSTKGTPMRALDLATAQKIAQAALEASKPQFPMKIISEHTKEYKFGFAFSYSPVRYLSSKNPDYLVPGLGPLIVDRGDHRAYFLSTARPPQQAINEYEAQWLLKYNR